MESERIEMHKSLVNEISKGMGQLKQVKVSSSTLDEEQERFLERMVSCYEEALFILTGRAPQGGGQCQSGITPSSNPPAPSPSVPKQGGARKRILNRVERRKYKTNASGDDPKGATGDGYSWRKYGQKPIKGSIYPRFYFRCRDKGCPARKQEERSTDDPATIHVTYEGVHTCADKSPSSTMGIIEQDQTFSFPSPNATQTAELEHYDSVGNPFDQRSGYICKAVREPLGNPHIADKGF